jgi:hypothetical protein
VSEGVKELSVIRIAIDRRPCENMTELSDLVYREKRRGPRTEPWGTPVVRAHGADTNSLHVIW